jgi:hypothetical protein
MYMFDIQYTYEPTSLLLVEILSCLFNSQLIVKYIKAKIEQRGVI